MTRAPWLRTITVASITALALSTSAYAADPAREGAERGSRFQQHLGLTDDQMQAIKQIRERRAEAWKQHFQAVQKAQAELRRLVLDGADASAVQAKQIELATLMASSVQMRVDALREIAPLLTLEQREKFAALTERGGPHRHHRYPRKES